MTSRQKDEFAMSIKSFAIAAILLLGVVSLDAQAPAAPVRQLVSVQGNVYGPDGRPLAGARVAILPPGFSDGDEVFADTMTDADGNYALLAISLQPGRYVVHASGIGFDGSDKTFEVKSDPLELSVDLTLKPQTKNRGISSAFAVVRIYYATDRAQVTNKASVGYGGARAAKGTLSYGACDVSIPASHVAAKFERPSIWRLEFHADPEKHLVLQKVTPESKDLFFEQVSDVVSSSPSKEAFVFIHGYNVSFESAAVRTAQLTYDFGFKGAPILYSWPSKASLFGYLADENAVTASTANLKQFLEDVANKSGSSVVHVIAHSMGNRATLAALVQLASDTQFSNFSKFSTMVFAAPDVDRDVFIDSIAKISKPKTSITLYVSQSDQALIASHLLFHKEPRAGEGGKDSIVLRGLDTVDVSGLSTDAMGHSYYGDNSEVVQDVLEFLRGHPAPRPNLSPIQLGSLAYWKLTALASAVN